MSRGDQGSGARRSRRGDVRIDAEKSTRKVDYHNLKSPFPAMRVFSDDRVAAIHQTALRVLKELGIRVLEPNARKLFQSAGAKVVDDMVYLDSDIVEAALATAPRRFTARAGARHRDITLELGNMHFQPGAGAPHATDLVRGRRPSSAQDFNELMRLTQSFDVFQMITALVEPQDVPPNLRHYFTLRQQITLTEKLPWVFARGVQQVAESFEMLRDARGIDDATFMANPWCHTVINTNSPRTLDMLMARGIIDFARAGQMVIITPFTLMGAMAPITVAGALTLSHAEALSGITLSQLAKPGAPVCYGTFTSSVDMKSGSPAFGTPSQFQASLGAGQLARHLGLPWRCAAGSAANTNDAQAANENQFGLWGCLLAGATVMIHSAGWLEGGLAVSYEKLVSDAEVLNMIAELCAGAAAGDDEIGFDAIAEVMPGGHFFATNQTMERYRTEFYPPILHDYANFGTWSERGSRDASTRATDVWRAILAEDTREYVEADRIASLDADIARKTAAGGAFPDN